VGRRLSGVVEFGVIPKIENLVYYIETADKKTVYLVEREPRVQLLKYSHKQPNRIGKQWNLGECFLECVNGIQDGGGSKVMDSQQSQYYPKTPTAVFYNSHGGFEGLRLCYRPD
jgi:hypothetical protein